MAAVAALSGAEVRAGHFVPAVIHGAVDSRPDQGVSVTGCKREKKQTQPFGL